MINIRHAWWIPIVAAIAISFNRVTVLQRFMGYGLVTLLLIAGVLCVVWLRLRHRWPMTIATVFPMLLGATLLGNLGLWYTLSHRNPAHFRLVPRGPGMLEQALPQDNDYLQNTFSFFYGLQNHLNGRTLKVSPDEQIDTWHWRHMAGVEIGRIKGMPDVDLDALAKRAAFKRVCGQQTVYFVIDDQAQSYVLLGAGRKAVIAPEKELSK